jgi:tetrahydromethanopterin S-methyltransferase subunit B
MDYNIISKPEIDKINIVFDDVTNMISKTINDKITNSIDEITASITDSLKTTIQNEVNQNIFPSLFTQNYRQITENEFYEIFYGDYRWIKYGTCDNTGFNRSLMDKIQANFKKKYDLYTNGCEYIIKIIKRKCIEFNDGEYNKYPNSYMIITNKLSCEYLTIYVGGGDNLFEIKNIGIIIHGKYYLPNDYIDILNDCVDKIQHMYQIKFGCSGCRGEQYFEMILPKLIDDIEKCVEKYLTNRTHDENIMKLYSKYNDYDNNIELHNKYIRELDEFNKLKIKFESESGIAEFEKAKTDLDEQMTYFKSASGIAEIELMKQELIKLEILCNTHEEKYKKDLSSYTNKKEEYESVKTKFDDTKNNFDRELNEDE